MICKLFNNAKCFKVYDSHANIIAIGVVTATVVKLKLAAMHACVLRMQGTTKTKVHPEGKQSIKYS